MYQILYGGSTVIFKETHLRYSRVLCILSEALRPSTLCGLSSAGGRDMKFPPYTTRDIAGLERLRTKAVLLRTVLSPLRSDDNLLKSFLSFHTDVVRWNPTQVTRLGGKHLLPTEPSCQLSPNSFSCPKSPSDPSICLFSQVPLSSPCPQSNRSSVDPLLLTQHI